VSLVATTRAGRAKSIMSSPGAMRGMNEAILILVVI
jgi:hypothetical protein